MSKPSSSMPPTPSPPAEDAQCPSPSSLPPIRSSYSTQQPLITDPVGHTDLSFSQLSQPSSAAPQKSQQRRFFGAVLSCISNIQEATASRRSASGHPSAISYRSWLCQAPPSSSRRLVHLESGVHRMTATPSGGDCGFHAISWALLHLSGPTLSSTDVRRKLSTHVRQNTAFYSDLLRRQGHWELADETANAVATFSRSVLMEGVNGHWLGQMWGEIELLALAKAFTVCVELYCFEVAPQQLRRYARFEEGKRVVRLLFTGSAQAGHFDVLLPRRTWW